ncbi:HAMP domain-containing sensor histidine kinase [Cohnella boryungensis]
MRKLYLLFGLYHLRLRLFWFVVLSFALALIATMITSRFVSDWLITLDQISNTLAAVLFFLLTATFLVFFILLFFVLTRPDIRFLQKTMHGISLMAAGDLNERVPAYRKDELGRLAAHINEMAAELQRQRQKERQGEMTRMELITGVSHDLRTPLTSMIGYIHLLKERGYRSEEEYDRYVEHTYNQAIRLQKRIDALFEYTRLTAPEAKAQFRRIRFNELLQQLLSEFQPLASEYGLTVASSLPEEELEVCLDPDKIVRALDNLLMNALKFSRRPGEIRINCRLTKDWLSVDIENDGEPLTKEQEERLFDRFYRGDSSRKLEDTGLGAGSGLGLAISKSIALLHGGDLTLNHERGHYRFRLELPRS